MRAKEKLARLYFDYAASTPVDPRVEKAMRPYWSDRFGNPGSLHSFGQEAMKAIDEARERVALSLGAHFEEIVFMSSATEANNLAIQGALLAARKKIKAPKIITTSIEHESVLEPVRFLEKNGVRVEYLKVNREGLVSANDLKNKLDQETVLVSIIWGSNEVGSLQDIKKIGEVIKSFREEQKSTYPLFHVDAAQAFPYMECRPSELEIDLLTISGQKIYGPKGSAVLYVHRTFNKRGVALAFPIEPLVHGGGQEFGLRSGTESVPLVVGLAEAVKLTLVEREKEAARVKILRAKLWQTIKTVFKKAEVNGVVPDTKKWQKEKEKTLPHILNVYIPRQSVEELLTALDLAGVAAASGSACSARSLEPSYVVQALGWSKERARSSLRFSLGRGSSISESIKFKKILDSIKNK